VQDWLTQVEATEKGCFVKQHVSWMIDPAHERQFLEPLHLHDKARGYVAPSLEDSSFIGERSEDNVTVLSDAMLKRFRPTFLIRNPALTFPSLLRCSTDVLTSVHSQAWSMNYYWSRRVYEWYDKHVSTEEKKSAVDGISFPLILDADDLSCRELVERYAAAVGLDAERLQWTWTIATPEEVAMNGKIGARMKDTILKSAGIVKGRTSEGLDVEVEKRKWVEEFGEEIAASVADMVDQAMEDYLWLKERKMAA